MTVLSRFLSVCFMLPVLLLTGCGSDTTESVTALTVSSSNTVLDLAYPERFVTITATVRDAQNNLLPNASVRFSTNLGSFSANSSVTSDTKETGRGGSQDAGNGVAAIKLYPGQTAGAATVTVFVNGFQQSVTININGSSGGGSDATTKAAAMTLATSNAVLDTAVPDRFINLDATVRDKDGNLLSNAQVVFTTSLGSFSATTPLQTQTQATVAGVASIKLYPGKTPGTATVTAFINGLQQTSSLTIQGADLELTYPATVSIITSSASLFVTGVGESDSTNFRVQLLTPAGLVARDGPTGINNVRVSLISKPNGGEYLKGINAAGTEVQSSSAIEVATKNGAVTVSLKAGTLPGIVQLKAEALNDAGQSYAPQILSLNQNINIASGPAHTLIVTYPENSMTNLNNGTYRKRGTLVVTDRYGNAVSDGTQLNLGILDSVISSNLPTDPNNRIGSTSAGSSQLTDPASPGFTSAAISRNNVQRFIEPSDRVLLPNAQNTDKSRFIAATPTQDNQISVTKSYLNNAQNLQYLIGASLLGTQIAGVVAGSANPVSGRASTVDGAATFFITFPANNQTILTGCPGFEADPRHQPAGSAQLWLVAEAAESSAVTIDNRSCMNAISPITLAVNPGQTTITGSSLIQLSVEDAGGIRLPFVAVQHRVSSEVNTGSLQVQVGQCLGRTDNKTDSSGVCYLPVTVTGGVTGDRAVITLTTLDASIGITVQR